MPNKASDILRNNIEKIMQRWEHRALKEIKGAHLQEQLALRDAIPKYLSHLVDALSTTTAYTDARKKHEREEGARLGREHGKGRAETTSYTIDQLIFEYHILRQVLFDVIESKGPMTDVEREVIICSIEQAVNDAATEFNDNLMRVAASEKLLVERMECGRKPGHRVA